VYFLGTFVLLHHQETSLLKTMGYGHWRTRIPSPTLAFRANPRQEPGVPTSLGYSGSDRNLVEFWAVPAPLAKARRMPRRPGAFFLAAQLTLEELSVIMNGSSRQGQE
jgi:hypothetical protein